MGDSPKKPLCQNHLWNNPNRSQLMATIAAVKNWPHPGEIMETSSFLLGVSRYGEHPGQDLWGRMPTEPFPTSKPVSTGKGSSELSKALVPLDAEYLQLLVWSLGKGTPPELRTLYRLMPKCTQVPHVLLAWEGPRCPNHLKIPGPNSWS